MLGDIYMKNNLLKKSLFQKSFLSQLSLILLGASSGAAIAQSNVTIYGIVDIGLQNLKNGNPSGSRTL